MLIKDIERFVEIYNDKNEWPKINDIAKAFSVSERSVRRAADKCRAAGIKLIDRSGTKQFTPLQAAQVLSPAKGTAFEPPVAEKITDAEIIAENIRLAKNLQKAQDKARIHNKAFRDEARLENALVELNQELIKGIDGLKLSVRPKYHNVGTVEHYGIVHWSDTHLNEEVDLPWNQFNWTIASRRIQKHVQVIKKMCKAFGIKHVLVAMTGDMLNSDRRTDELVSNAGNRAQACLLATDLYQQALMDLNEDLNVTVAAVSGNEARIPMNVGWDKLVASENYDFTIFEILKRLLDSKGIKFIAGADPSEVVVTLGDQNILLLHGHGALENKAPLKTVQQAKGRYMAHGVHVDMVIWGHVHECLIADYYARSSSLAGTNDYSEKALGLSGRASQNFYMLSSVDKGFHGLKIDLQDTNGLQGYNIQKQLETYNTKSAIKAGKTIIVHTIEL